MAVNLELGVDLGSFNQGINQAKAQISAFNATLKFAESSFKATGDAEAAMTSKTQALNGKLQAQKSMVQQYAKALEQMRKNGVDQTSEAYLKMQKNMILAQASMNDTQAALNGLNSSQQEAAQSADKLTQSVQGISKKVSLEQVIGGIDRITDGLERAAQKAIQFGEKLWETIMDSAQRAGDQAEVAQMYNIPLQRYKQMLGLEAEGLKTTTDAILSSQKKLNSNIGKGSSETLKTLRELGLLFETGKGAETFITTDTVEMFWKAGQAMMNMGEGWDKEAAAMSLFGRSWNELVPLFQQYRSLEEYNKALDGVNVTSETATNNLDTLGDRVGALEHTWTSLKDEILSAVAPGLTQGADALNGVLSTILEYLQKPEGQAMLEQLGKSISGLFDDLTKVNPEEVVTNFVEIFNKLTSALEFINKNWQDIVHGIEAIGIAFGALKIGEGVLEGLRLINGFKTLNGGGGGDQTQTTGTKTGGLKSKIMNGIGAMIVVDYDPAKSLEYQKEYGRSGWAKYMDDLYGTNQYELVEKWKNGELKNEESFLQQVAESPKNLAKVVWDALTNKGKAGDWSGANGDDWSAQVTVEPITEENAAADIAEQVGVVTIPANIQVVSVSTGGGGKTRIGSGGGGAMVVYDGTNFNGLLKGSFANGIPYIPDTMLAWLHKGERVLTASENKSYTFNSNTYFGNVNLNNGMQIDALSESLAKQNRRQSAAYGA